MTTIRHACEVEVEHRQGLQTLDEAVRIIVEDDALIQQSLWIEDSLQLFHHLIGRLAPLVFHKRCHIATCTVLSLQRTIIFLNDQLRHIAHHLGIASHFVLIGKTLIQDEVVVAFKSMSVDTSIIVSVIGNQLLQLHRSLRQRFDGESHILDET